VNDLASPDVIALQEIQDNNGTINNGPVAADQTLQMLVDAISSAGGPAYEAFDVAPADASSGGAPGGNIRNAFLYNPDRVDLEDFASITPDVLADIGASNPDAFLGTRNPLMATFKSLVRKILAIKKFHGNIATTSGAFGGVGRADFLAANMGATEAEAGNSIIVSAGDLIGASPLISALFP
jgi:hypothetical protein